MIVGLYTYVYMYVSVALNCCIKGQNKWFDLIWLSIVVQKDKINDLI